MNVVDLAILKKMIGGGSGTNNYNDLSNLPQINGETLAGNKTAANLGLQDALTFDSVPTEDSTNPVESGGVYNALAGKQDNLTFDGVYNASTNKAATESTVTNAIAGLDVSAYSVDADETISSISETDGKISVNKQNIAIASSQVVAMTGYTKPSSAPATPAIQQGDTANEAIGKLEYKADVNQTNILSVASQNPISVYSLDSKSMTGAGYLVAENTPVKMPKGNYNIAYTSDKAISIVLVVSNGNTEIHRESMTCAIGANSFNFTTTTNGDNIRVYVSESCEIDNLCIVPKVYRDCGYTDYVYALPNYDLTRLEAEDRASLAEVVDSGAKNILDVSNIANLDNVTVSDGTFTTAGDTATTLRMDAKLRNGSTTLATIVNAQTISANGVYNWEFVAVANTNNLLIGHNGGTYNGRATINLTNLVVGQTYVLSLNVTQATNASGQFKWKDVMICTKAAFGVSQKFVPYRPNWDLVSSVAPFYSVPINHSMIYRGQNLGASLTDAQHTALSSGNFTDLYLGDYWTKTVTIPAFYEVTTAEPADWSTNYTSYYTKSGDTYTPVSGDTTPTWEANTYYERLVQEQTNITLKAVIADLDTFYAGYASSYAGINTHHAGVIVTGFNNVVWNKTNSTAGGYVSSLIHKWLVGSVLPQLESWFGSAKVLSHQKLLTNAITGDAASGWAWSSQKISLLSECQLYGMKVWGGSKATNGAYEPGEAFKKLDVFNHIDANLLFGNRNIWCRDIASAGGAAYLDRDGRAGSSDASTTWIAPAALILLS